MALAITVDGVPGSNEDVAINALRQLNLTGILGTPSAFLWTLLDKPPGSATALSSTTIQNPTITPDSEGGYHLRAEVTGTGGYQRHEVHLVVRQLKTRARVLPAGYNANDPYQSVGDPTDGWAPPVQQTTRLLDSMYAAEYGVVVGAAGTSGLLPGNVVRISGGTTIKSGLPGEEVVPTWVIANASTASHAGSMLGVVIEGVDGSGTPANGALIRVRVAGRVSTNTTGSAAGAPVFLSDAGAPSFTPGTFPRRIATVHSVGNPGQIWFNGYGPTVDTDEDIVIGRVKMGGYSSGDQLRIAHVDQAVGDYALRQTAGGITVLNSAQGQTLILAVGDSSAWNILSTKHLQPAQNNALDVGDTTNRVRSVYAGTSIILGAAGGVTITENTGFVVAAGFIASNAGLGLRATNTVAITQSGNVTSVSTDGSATEIKLTPAADARSIRLNGTGIGFFGAAPVAKQTSGADLTNNVTSGGTNDTIANFTDLTTYANDAATIRNDIYQLARKLKQVNDALRLYGILT